jgi:hypothetical protein
MWETAQLQMMGSNQSLWPHICQQEACVQNYKEGTEYTSLHTMNIHQGDPHSLLVQCFSKFGVNANHQIILLKWSF